MTLAQRLSAVAAATALVCTGPVLSTASAASGAEFTLTGSRTASVDVILASTTTFDIAGADLIGAGKFVGFYAEAIDVPVSGRSALGTHLGTVAIRDFHAPGQPAARLDFDPSAGRTLSPGTYRFYLLADGVATVRLPISGAVSYHPRATHSEIAQEADQSDILTSPLQAANRQTLTVSGVRSTVISAIMVGKFRAYAGQIGACLAALEGSCGKGGSANGADGTYTGWLVSPLNDTFFTWAVEYQPGALTPGRYSAVQTAFNATTLQSATGAAISLSLR